MLSCKDQHNVLTTTDFLCFPINMRTFNSQKELNTGTVVCACECECVSGVGGWGAVVVKIWTRLDGMD